ncbi:MAG TPA: CPBP family glutamic-type intramembrane protease [Terracidiphilus sp.]|nr:CPBP family glutamic-type intramembrane protease [Terracidiphilus sp.]
MTSLPPQDPNQPQLPFADFPEGPAPPEPPAPDFLAPVQPPPFTPEPPLFQSISAWAPPPERTPNFGHAALLAIFALIGLLCASLLAQLALSHHLFGIHTTRRAAEDIHYTLGTEAIIYLVTLLISVVVFPFVWRQSFFRGIHWRGFAALRLRYRLFAAAALCFLLAMFNGVVMPGPSNAPIDRLFCTPGAAWILFAFGVTFAPFFEELAFRGFLLPSFCTAYDWIVEQLTTPANPLQPPRPLLAARTVADIFLALPIFALMPYHHVGYLPRTLFLSAWVFVLAVWWLFATLRQPHRAPAPTPLLDSDGHPLWSFHAMTVASVLTSVPFALMHGEQTSYALGPFLLLVAVSLVLSWTRLLTRSLASSVLVHASYNFLLFGFMFLGTSGFRHLDRM